MPKLLLMFIEFFKTGLFAVGGGLATIPFLTDIANKYDWYTLEDLSTMIAVSESTPGPMGVNMATYVGYSQYGILGAFVVTMGLVLPSIIVICIIANMLEKFKNAKIVNEIFSGLKPAVVAFIVAATVDIFVTTLFGDYTFSAFNYIQAIMLVVFLGVSYKFPKVHPIWFIIAAAVLGIVLGL